MFTWSNYAFLGPLEMTMEDQYTTEWWLWQLYRQVSHYVHRPDERSEAQLQALITQYREFASRHREAPRDYACSPELR